MNVAKKTTKMNKRIDVTMWNIYTPILTGKWKFFFALLCFAVESNKIEHFKIIIIPGVVVFWFHFGEKIFFFFSHHHKFWREIH